MLDDQPLLAVPAINKGFSYLRSAPIAKCKGENARTDRDISEYPDGSGSV